MSDPTYNTTSEDVRDMQSEESRRHGGDIPKGSDAAIMQQILSEQEDKSARVDRVKANLPLPEDPPGPPPPGFNSADARTVNVGSGGVNVKLGTESSNGLRGPATAESGARVEGAAFKKNVAPRNQDLDIKVVDKPGNYKER